MRKPSLQKLIEQKAAIEAAIRAARAAQASAEKAAERREIAALVDRAIRAGATAAQVQAALDAISTRGTTDKESKEGGEQHV